jgi:hypothetical protein
MLEGEPEEHTIRIRPVDNGWPGAWWLCSFQGMNVEFTRDPAHAMARLLYRTGIAHPADTLVIVLEGREIAREQVSVAGRRGQKKQIFAHLWTPPPEGKANLHIRFRKG